MPRVSGLGRGLEALIPATGPAARLVDIDLVVPNPQQPRSVMPPEALEQLAQSIREHGILQPLLVTEVPGDAGTVIYQLIAGERRLQAARKVGLERVPVIVREATPQQQLEFALIENIQRADLSPLEEASAYDRLVSEFGLTQEEVGARVGRSRTAVTNALRLLGLEEELKASLARGEMTEGHARALLGIRDGSARREAWRQVVQKGLSVRQAEALARRSAPRRRSAARASAAHPGPVESQTEDLLRKALGTKVAVQRGPKGGTVTIHFFSDEEFDTIVNYLLGV